MELDDSESCIAAKHRKEKKELQAQIMALKKAAKNDKSKKKNLSAEIVRLESELELRQKQEIEANVIINVHPSADSDSVSEVTKSKVSKAQRRRDKKAVQDIEREEHIKHQEKENLNGPRNIEIKAISVKLKERCLNIYQIPSDGDCLYKAIAHQVLIRRQQNYSVDQLRENVAHYIKSNKEDFMPFMSNSNTGDMLTDTEFEIYCDKILNTKAWGGQLEIRALSNFLKCPITIIQATGPDSIEQGVEFDGPPLVITYHRHMYSLGEHYNSTQCISDDVEQREE